MFWYIIFGENHTDAKSLTSSFINLLKEIYIHKIKRNVSNYSPYWYQSSSLYKTLSSLIDQLFGSMTFKTKNSKVEKNLTIENLTIYFFSIRPN